MNMDAPRLHESEERDIKAAAAAIHGILNRGFTGDGPKALAHFLANDHRTLVQTAMRDLIIPFIGYLAEQGRAERYDDRNKGSVMLAMELNKTIAQSEHFLPHI